MHTIAGKKIQSWYEATTGNGTGNDGKTGYIYFRKVLCEDIYEIDHGELKQNTDFLKE